MMADRIINLIVAMAMLCATVLVTIICVAVFGTMVDPVALMVIVPYIMMVALLVFYGT
jgi:hypothetical protein